MRAAATVLLMAALPAPLCAQQPPAGAQDAASSPLRGAAERVVRVLRGEQSAAAVFAPSFLAAVPEAQLRTLTAQFEREHGRLLAVEALTPAGDAAANVTLRFERALARAGMTIETGAPHRVTGLRITSFEPLGDNAGKIAADLAALPGRTAAWFGPLGGGAPVLSHNADTQLPLGSAFKLYVLAALDRAVREGRHRWDQVVPLAARSYPSGLTQDWPADTPVTLATLATLMIQISDNTATDRLIALLGRDRVEAEMRLTNPRAAASLPFLTTRELFVIKADPALRARFAAAGEGARREILREIAARFDPPAQIGAAFAGPPIASDRLEWFASPQELAALLNGFTGPEMTRIRGILAANNGGIDAATAARWRSIGYKGGSEPGVLNLTWLLQDRAGNWHMLTLGWNDPAAPVDTARLHALAMRMLALAPLAPAP
ncbi:serine hydrolase [Qipengyuania sediminis]|uniref:serine hydrolase n=1 Tax=Qipengyuania sediminis TaxID=1532023 RepID=UPI00105A77BB|nr:serine hydrolase [Qipengyuania sediminis]